MNIKRALGGIAIALAAATAGGIATRVLFTNDTGHGVAPAVRYQCPMHPSYTADKPGDCPICGMRLVPVEARGDKKVEASAASEPGDPSLMRTEAPVGRATVVLSPERRRLLGLRTEPVRRAALQRRISTVGRVAVDERRLHHVHIKYEAYVEHLLVDFIGKFVRKGEPLLSLFSPELVATQQEYLLAWRAQNQLSRSGLPSVAQGGMDLLEAARRRLLLWGIRPADITRLEATGEVMRTMNLYSPVSGYVVQKMAFHGMRVMPADTLFDIADLSQLWVLADVYESDLATIRMGMAAETTVAYLPGRSWSGSVTYIAPFVEEKTRTVKVRIEVANRDGALKPEMFADVMLVGEIGSGLVVPESAVIHAGRRQLVFVDRGDRGLIPTEVQLGPKVAGGVQVLAGLDEGSPVVTSANFLVDSESSLRAALATISPPPAVPPSASAAPATTSGHRH
jgi:Cu(I)/Ag(I) efflux system membrane fusion protein